MSSCEMCQYLINFEKNPEQGGYCKRFPPQVNVVTYQVRDGEWQAETHHDQPCVALNDTCGEFKSREGSE